MAMYLDSPGVKIEITMEIRKCLNTKIIKPKYIKSSRGQPKLA